MRNGGDWETTMTNKTYKMLSTRGRRSCYPRPVVALLAAEGNATTGRESMTSYWERREL